METAGSLAEREASPDQWAHSFPGAQVRSSCAAPTWWDGCYVDVVEHAPPQPEHVRTEHGSYHGVVLITNGAAKAEDRLQDGPVHYTAARPGDLHVYSRVRNEEPHLSRWHEPISFVSVRLAPKVVAKVCKIAPFSYDATTFVSRFRTDDPFLRQLVLQLARTLKATVEPSPAPSHRLYVDQLQQALAAHLVQHYTAAPGTRPQSSAGLPPDRLRRVKEYIAAHLDEDIALEDMAAAACYSEYHFCRAFKQNTGSSPYQYVIQRRMEQSARLLRQNPHQSVASVARAVGYDSPSHFSRQFKKHHGVPPSRWRQEVR
jgi:AraC family transcriptional regulator